MTNFDNLPQFSTAARVQGQASLHQLLAAWNAHQDLRRAGTAADLTALVASRDRLDTVRAQLCRSRDRATMAAREPVRQPAA